MNCTTHAQERRLVASQNANIDPRSAAPFTGDLDRRRKHPPTRASGCPSSDYGLAQILPMRSRAQPKRKRRPEISFRYDCSIPLFW